MRKTPIILAAAALMVGLACSGAPNDDDSDTAGPQQIGTTAQEAAATSAPPAGPITAFADGTYQIGAGAGLVPPGTYKTTVPADSRNCYWERQKAFGGGIDAIIANDNHNPGEPVIVTIAPTDKGFKTSGCGTWKQ